MARKKRRKKYTPRAVPRNISVQAELRDMPDFKRLARAVTLLARQDLGMPPVRNDLAVDLADEAGDPPDERVR